MSQEVAGSGSSPGLSRTTTPAAGSYPSTKRSEMKLSAIATKECTLCGGGFSEAIPEPRSPSRLIVLCPACLSATAHFSLVG